MVGLFSQVWTGAAHRKVLSKKKKAPGEEKKQLNPGPSCREIEVPLASTSSFPWGCPSFPPGVGACKALTVACLYRTYLSRFPRPTCRTFICIWHPPRTNQPNSIIYADSTKQDKIQMISGSKDAEGRRGVPDDIAAIVT